ncbi:MAG: glycosyltransferase, partial [Schleiferiaceae bacterium]|nr:glycosyltransferase [Schleiferiaceae bacterium]
MQALPTVSVIVPNFMHAAYLEARLASIACQSYQDFEVIMLDDASTAGSLAILESWATKDERFRL